jgi:hypothetical protein
MFSKIVFEKNTKGMNHLKMVKVTLTKWSLYAESRASSGYDTKKGRAQSTRDYETREARGKKTETNHEQNSGQKKKKRE